MWGQNFEKIPKVHAEWCQINGKFKHNMNLEVLKKFEILGRRSSKSGWKVW